MRNSQGIVAEYYTMEYQENSEITRKEYSENTEGTVREVQNLGTPHKSTVKTQSPEQNVVGTGHFRFFLKEVFVFLVVFSVWVTCPFSEYVRKSVLTRVVLKFSGISQTQAPWRAFLEPGHTPRTRSRIRSTQCASSQLWQLLPTLAMWCACVSWSSTVFFSSRLGKPP